MRYDKGVLHTQVPGVFYAVLITTRIVPARLENDSALHAITSGAF
jgi:hypothetical protein